jgi:hypothetical protein
MNNVVLDRNVGKPWQGDLVWSALPDAPVREDRPRLVRLKAWAARMASRRSQTAAARTPAAGRITRSMLEIR